MLGAPGNTRILRVDMAASNTLTYAAAADNYRVVKHVFGGDTELQRKLIRSLPQLSSGVEIHKLFERMGPFVHLLLDEESQKTKVLRVQFGPSEKGPFQTIFQCVCHDATLSLGDNAGIIIHLPTAHRVPLDTAILLSPNTARDAAQCYLSGFLRITPEWSEEARRYVDGILHGVHRKLSLHPVHIAVRRLRHIPTLHAILCALPPTDYIQLMDEIISLYRIKFISIRNDTFIGIFLDMNRRMSLVHERFPVGVGHDTDAKELHRDARIVTVTDNETRAFDYVYPKEYFWLLVLLMVTNDVWYVQDAATTTRVNAPTCIKALWKRIDKSLERG